MNKVGDSVHWYDVNGEPHHDAGLRDARVEGYLPSVTTITKEMANFGLEQYKLKQMFEASLTLPRDPEESDSDFAKRVMEDSREHARKAAELGTMIHTWVARYLQGKQVFWGPYRKILEPLKVWVDLNIVGVVGVEFVTVGPDYAGTVDLVAELATGERGQIDWKSTFIVDPGIGKRGKPLKPKVSYYDSWVMQHAAYDVARHGGPSDDQKINVVISTNTDFPMVTHKAWSEPELARGWEMFEHCKGLWKARNRYWPREAA